jgi:hypothetical protein
MSESDEPQVSRRQLFTDLASGLHRGIMRATGLDQEEEQEDGDAYVRRAIQRAEGHLAELQAFMSVTPEDPASEET